MLISLLATTPALAQSVHAEVEVDVTAPLPALPVWALDLAGLPLLPTAQSILDGITWQACSTPGPAADEICSLPVPLFTPVPVDLDRAAAGGGLLGLVRSPDFVASLGLVAGDAQSAAALLDPRQIDAIGDGVALRFELTRAATDLLDGARATHGRIYARLHIPAVGYDAVLGFESPDSLADGSLVTLGVRGEDIPAATAGRFAADFVLTHTPATDHALLVGLARVERDGVLGPRAVHDPLSLALRFDAAPSRMDGLLRAEQVPGFEALAVEYTLPAGERPILDLVARQDFTSDRRLQPDVATRHLRARVERMPGAASLEVAHDLVADRDRVIATLSTDASAAQVEVAEGLELIDGGTDQLHIALTDLPALDCGSPCTRITAFLPRALAEGRFDPVVNADFGVDPDAARLGLTLQTDRPAGVGALLADARALPTILALDADVDLAAQTGVVRWSADRPGATLDRLQLQTAAVQADLTVQAIPNVLDLAVDPTRLQANTNGAIGRVRGWLTTTGAHPALRPGAHLVGGLTLADRATLALALDVPGVARLDLRTVDCAGYLCATLANAAVDEEIGIDLDAAVATPVDTQRVRIAGSLDGLPPNTELTLARDAIELRIDGPIGAALRAAIGETGTLGDLALPALGGITARVDPTDLRAGVHLATLPERLRLELAAIRRLRSLGDPADMFASDATVAIGPDKDTWTSPLQDAAPLAVLEGVPTGRIDLDVVLLDAAGAVALTVGGGLDVGAPISALTVGPIGVNAPDAETRGIEARLRRTGGALAIDGLTVAVRKGVNDPRRDILRADLPVVPARFDLFSAIGGDEIELPGRFNVDFRGLALLLDHSGDLPALGVAYRDEALPLAGQAAWHIDAQLAKVPERVWLVTSGGRGGESTSGCVGLFFPTPSLEYVASRAGLGLDVVLRGSLVSPNIDATQVEAHIEALPVRASINALNAGARVLQIAGFSDPDGRTPAFIEGLDIGLDAAVQLRLDCGVSVGSSPFTLGGRIKVGADGRQLIRAGRIGLGFGGVRNIEIDFGDVWTLFGLYGTAVDWEGFYLDLRHASLDVDLPISGEVYGCAGASIAGKSYKRCADFGVDATVNLSLGLEPHYFDTDRTTTLRSTTIVGCDVDVRLGVGRRADADGAELTMVYPRGLPGDRALTVLAAIYLVLRGDLSASNLLDFDVDCPEP